ncbi:putative mitochondrial protein [Apostasia shenzhenica]|uniref:Putative mitochondrial protein n=1 Tax=Apostasia shenzhenica TaxID=1088818 RepID=A0A2I0AGM1_9ASPA|nr:putative mitochondrial protein [Apostasia shenzhenica]
MRDCGTVSYFLGLEVNQGDEGIFISQEGYAKEILKRYNMEDCNSINTPIEMGSKVTREREGRFVDPTLYKSLVGSRKYLTCMLLDIFHDVGLVSRYIEQPRKSHWKAAKRILQYIKGTISCGLFYTNSNVFQLAGFTNTRIVIGEVTWMIGRVHLASHSIQVEPRSYGCPRNNT